MRTLVKRSIFCVSWTPWPQRHACASTPMEGLLTGLLTALLTGLSVLAAPSAFASDSNEAAPSTQESITLNYRGDAFALNSGNLLYTEHHTLTLDAQSQAPLHRLTSYQDADTREFARKENTYSDNPATPEFSLHDSRLEYRESLTFDGKRWRSEFTENGKTSKAKLGKPDYTPVVDSGFDEFVRMAWPKLLKGKTVNFSFAVPSREEWVNFRLIPVQQSESMLTVEMRLKSRLIAWLLDPVKLEYDLSSQRLRTYRGLTNMKDAQGKGMVAEIRYHYPDEVTQ